MKKIVSFAAVVMTAGIFAGCSTAKTQTAGNNQTGNTIKIGVNMELSGQQRAMEIHKNKGFN